MKFPIYFLLSNVLEGFISVLILFALCFFSVHFFKLVIIGWEHQTRKPIKKDEPSPPEPKPPEPKPQPVYYIVEKQKRRKKPTHYK